MKKSKKIIYFVGICIGFLLISLLFYYPIVEGKQIFQSDIQQFKGMARQLHQYKDKGEDIYWIDNAFVGMPTYQVGATYPWDILGAFNTIIRLIPHPAFILFLYLFSFFVFLTILKVPYRYAVFGALAYGFSTYLLIIIQVGHNTKAICLGYLPLIFSGAYLIFKNKPLRGGLLTLMALGLQIRSNHYQMTYYTLLLLLIITGVFFYYAIKDKNTKSFVKKIGILALAGIFAIGLNATPILATAEYSKHSTRGASDLQLAPNGTPKEKTKGLNYDYITEYSYGIFESINLFVPRIQGGGSTENVGTQSNTYLFLTKQGVPPSQAKSFVKNLPTYWGKQPILEAPAYIGISIIFLAILAFFLLKRKQQLWLTIGILFSLFLSWGKNFPILTHFFIDYFPLYNKFRAVSSIQIILEFCFPVLATLGIFYFFEKENTKKMNYLKRTIGIVGGFLIALLLLKGSFSFHGVNDNYLKQFYPQELINQIILDRKKIYTQDIIRGIIIISAISIVLYLFLQKKVKKQYLQLAIVTIMLFDIVGIANRYVDRSSFVTKRQLKKPFLITDADKKIIEDTTRFRVFEPKIGLNSARTAYFHNAIGGYHGAKPRLLQELYDFFIFHKNFEILNILNVKYILQTDEQGKTEAIINEKTLGNAWTIQQLITVDNPDEMINALNKLNLKKQAAILKKNTTQLKQTQFKKDTTAIIQLTKATPQRLEYRFYSQYKQFVVFSEMYYKNGWKAYIDDKPTQHYQVNYLLRGMTAPKGNHTITFVFDPAIIKIGTTIRIITLSLLGIILITIGGYHLKFKKKLF